MELDRAESDRQPRQAAVRTGCAGLAKADDAEDDSRDPERREREDAHGAQGQADQRGIVRSPHPAGRKGQGGGLSDRGWAHRSGAGDVDAGVCGIAGPIGTTGGAAW